MSYGLTTRIASVEAFVIVGDKDYDHLKGCGAHQDV